MMRIKPLLKNIASQRYLLLLIVWALVLTITNAIHIQTYNPVPHWDMSRHLLTSLDYFNNVSFSGSGLQYLVYHFAYYPPLVYLATLPWYAAFGNDLLVAVISNFQWLLILVLSVYGIGKRFWSERVGFGAALTVTLIPIVLGQSREYQIDLQLTAIVALAFYVLLLTDRFKHLGYSILFGGVVGLGFLTKWTFGAFLIVPAALVGGLGLYEAYRQKDWRPVRNMILTALVICLIDYPWYRTNYQALSDSFSANGVNAGLAEGDPQAFWPSVLWHGGRLLDIQIFLPLTIFMVIGVGYAVSRVDWLKRNWLILLTALVPFLIFCILPNKDVRYTMPTYPFLALLAVYWIAELPGLWRRLAAIGLGLVLTLNFFFLALELPKVHNIDFKIGNQNIILLSNVGYTSSPIDPVGDSPRAIVETAAGLAKHCSGQPALFLYGPNLQNFGHMAFLYENQRLGTVFAFPASPVEGQPTYILIYGTADKVAEKAAETAQQYQLEELKAFASHTDIVSVLYRIQWPSVQACS